MNRQLAGTRLVPLGLFLAATACSPAPSSASSIEESFTLRLGESASLEGADLTLTFEEVTRDSRCPPDVVCVVAGEAVIVLEAVASGRREELVFEVPPGGGDTKLFESFTIAITELEPPTDSERPIDPSRYVAHVTVRREAP